MTVTRGIFSRLATFRENQLGSTAVTFALAIVPLLFCAGVAIDYMRYANARTELQAAIDASALAIAAAADLTAAQRIKAGEAAFDENISAQKLDGSKIDRKFKFVGDEVEGAATYELPTSLMQLAGFNNMAVEVETAIRMPEKKKAEIVLVLDYSGSMKEKIAGQVKYIAMKNAAKKMVNDLKTANIKNLKIGLVPFSHHVWTTMPKQYVRGQTGPGNWTGCTQDRLYPINLTDTTPTADDATKWGQPIAAVHAADGCAAYVPNRLTVLPLTTDLAAVNAQLDVMVPYAWTHIALGAEFGFQLLSPTEPFAEGMDFGTKNGEKIMVILTDGAQTEPAYGSTKRTVAQGEANLESICTNAKDKGITVMTIAYDIDDNDTVKRLRRCTTDPTQHFFKITDSDNIADAFKSIKAQISAQIFISR